MTRRALKLAAKPLVRDHWVPSVLVVLAGAALLGLSGFLVVGPLLLGGPLLFGAGRWFLGLVRQGPPAFGVAFSGFQRWGSAFFTFFLQSLFTLLWGLLLIVPGIVAALAYSQVWYLLAEDPNLTAREALRKSKALMDGRKGEFFLLQLSFFWWGLLCVVTLGLALLYVGPYYSTVMAGYYQSLHEEA